MSSAFPSMTEPLRIWRWRCFALACVAIAASVAAAVWALRPLPRAESPTPFMEVASATVPVADEVVALDRSVFDRNPWWVLPNPGEELGSTPTPKPQALPLAIDLVGVLSVNGALVAALYDRGADRLLLVRHGEAIADAKVSELTNDRVTLTRGEGELVLVRRRPGP